MNERLNKPDGLPRANVVRIYEEIDPIAESLGIYGASLSNKGNNLCGLTLLVDRDMPDEFKDEYHTMIRHINSEIDIEISEVSVPTPHSKMPHITKGGMNA